MGIQVDDDFAAIGSDGRASRRLFALGPLLRGSLWETTAVPELRGQAMRVAEALSSVSQPRSRKWKSSNTTSDGSLSKIPPHTPAKGSFILRDSQK